MDLVPAIATDFELQGVQLCLFGGKPYPPPRPGSSTLRLAALTAEHTVAVLWIVALVVTAKQVLTLKTKRSFADARQVSDQSAET
jgi:hypothetical protein